MPGDPAPPVLILFAKSPVPGRVKTRLMPELNASQAAEVATELIERTVRLAVENWPGRIKLQTWPDSGHALFKKLAVDHKLKLDIQGSGDLGAKMCAALGTFTDRGQPAAVMGSDVPHCPAENLRRAGKLLRQGKNIIGPSTDGGYYLIGLQRTLPEIFQGIQWGGQQVLSATLRTAEQHGIPFTRLRAVTDIDNFVDLQMLARKQPFFCRWADKPENS